MKKIILFILIFCIVSSTVSAFSFPFFGKSKIVKEQSFEVEQQIQEIKKEIDMINVEEGLKLANNENLFLKPVVGKRFCLISEQRTLYFKITSAEDVVETNFNKDCYKIKFDEQKSHDLLQRYLDGELLSYDDITSAVKVPIRLKVIYLWGML